MSAPSLLPPNALAGDRAIEAAAAHTARPPIELSSLWDPMTCRADLLPWLAWGLSIDIWDPDWSEATKRQMIAEAIARQRRKGTPAAVDEVLDAFGVGLTQHEWFEPDVQGEPYTFEIRLPIAGGQTIAAAFIEKVADQVARVKRGTAHFSVAQMLRTTGDVGVLAIARAACARRFDVIQADSDDWSGVLLTEDGEPILTETDAPLEIDLET